MASDEDLICDCECRCDDYPTWQHVAVFCATLALFGVLGAFVMAVAGG